jgi:hypothetical protein
MHPPRKLAAREASALLAGGVTAAQLANLATFFRCAIENKGADGENLANLASLAMHRRRLRPAS